MSELTKKELFEKVLTWFSMQMPEPETELHYKDPFHLLVAVILSAQCTDKRVNMITPPLLARFPDAAAMAGASHEELLSFIGSCSYPNNKARHLKGMSTKLVVDYEGKVPRASGELQKLPGVGRKTANVVASVLFGEPAMAVDTHVFRVSARIGLTTNARTPLEAERQLVEFIPEELISRAHHWLILHGRYVCQARKPLCESCGLRDVCRWYNSRSKEEEA